MSGYDLNDEFYREQDRRYEDFRDDQEYEEKRSAEKYDEAREWFQRRETAWALSRIDPELGLRYLQLGGDL